MRITTLFCLGNGTGGARQSAFVAASFCLASLLTLAMNREATAQVRFRDIQAAPFAGDSASDQAEDGSDTPATPKASVAKRPLSDRSAQWQPANDSGRVQWQSMGTGQMAKETEQPPAAYSPRATKLEAYDPPSEADVSPARPAVENKAKPSVKHAAKPAPSYNEDWETTREATDAPPAQKNLAAPVQRTFAPPAQKGIAPPAQRTAAQPAQRTVPQQEQNVVQPAHKAVPGAARLAQPKAVADNVKRVTYQEAAPVQEEAEEGESPETRRGTPSLKRSIPGLPVALQAPGDSLPPPPTPGTIAPMPGSPFEVIDETGEWTVTIRRSKLLRTSMNIYRTAVVDPSVCDVVQFTPREVSIIGRGQGATHVTFWFEGDKLKPITYLVRVVPDPEVQQRREKQYHIFEEILAELFPDSKVHLQPIADKLIVKGQAKDGEEAAQIMAIIRGEAVRGGRGDHGYGSLIEGRASDPIQGEERDRKLPATQVVNMLRIPGIQQVALRVKIAELNRTAARQFGVDLDLKFDIGDGSLLLQSMLNAAAGGSASVLGHFDGDKINFGIHFLEQHGVVRLLSEPTLVTMSGRPASFVAGGEFAVPTTVGISGASAVTTEFRSFGAIISFLPTVLDKDRIRLEVAPEFSKINTSLTVNNTPGLDTRAVTTTVEMREGQTLAIAGLLDDAMTYNSATDLPILCNIFGRRTGSRNETELMILVTPELVQPMDPEEVPPLPGFDVTEPSHNEFYFQGQIEGRPTRETRSTVWPTLRRRYQGTSAMMSGPFGHGQ